MRKLKFAAGAKFTWSPGVVGQPSIEQVLAIVAKAPRDLALAGGQAIALWECFLGPQPDKSIATGFIAIDFIGSEESAQAFPDAFGACLSAQLDGPASEIRLRLDDEEFVVRIHHSMNGADLFGPHGQTSLEIDSVNVLLMDPLALFGVSIYSLVVSTRPTEEDLACARRCIRVVDRFISNAASADLDRALNLTEWFLEALQLPDTRKTFIQYRLPVLEAAPLSALESAAQGDRSQRAQDRLARLRRLYSEARRDFTEGSTSHAE